LTIENKTNTNTSKNDDFLHYSHQKMLYRKQQEIIISDWNLSTNPDATTVFGVFFLPSLRFWCKFGAN
jgi:hypothetical protein